jgi:hypothetical protein
MPPPLDGIWATAPYLHNGSVPTHRAAARTAARADATGSASTTTARTSTRTRSAGRGSRWRRRSRSAGRGGEVIYDTTYWSQSNKGHRFGDHLSDDERRAVIEYLKTL